MATQNDFFGDNPFAGFLDFEPEAAFFSFQPQFGQSQNQQRFFRNRFQEIHHEFLGRLGQQIRGGELPTERFTDFLGDFNFGERFASTAPSLRGGAPRSLFAPRTRFLPF